MTINWNFGPALPAILCRLEADQAALRRNNKAGVADLYQFNNRVINKYHNKLFKSFYQNGHAFLM
jgi:hypothetical protein